MAKKSKPTYDKTWYLPTNLTQLLKTDPGAVRKEYTRLRDISQKRLKRFEAAGLTETQAYRKNVKHYPLLKDIKSNYELAGRLSDLERFITAKAGSVSGQREIRKKSIATLHENQYTFVNEQNFDDFTDFMEAYRDELYDMEYDSGDAADLFGVVVKQRLDPEKVKKDFEFWLDNIDKAKKMRTDKKTIGDYDQVKAKLQKRIDQADKKASSKKSRRAGK